MNPLISVVMGAHNEEAHIAEAISSILHQTYDCFEFIIIDDASTDRTRDIIRHIRDNRIRLLINDTNIGLTKSLNIGLRASKGTLVARMDANDIADPSRFKKQVALFRDHTDIDLVWTEASYITESGDALCPKSSPPSETVINLLESCTTNFPVKANYVNHISVMFRLATVMTLGGYDEDYKWGQDGNLWCRMLKSGAHFHRIDESLMQIRLTSEGVSATTLGVSVLDPNEYYSKICRRHGHYRKALRYMQRMPWNLRKLHQFASITSHYVRHSLGTDTHFSL